MKRQSLRQSIADHAVRNGSCVVWAPRDVAAARALARSGLVRIVLVRRDPRSEWNVTPTRALIDARILAAVREASPELAGVRGFDDVGRSLLALLNLEPGARARLRMVLADCRDACEEIDDG